MKGEELEQSLKLVMEDQIERMEQGKSSQTFQKHLNCSTQHNTEMGTPDDQMDGGIQGWEECRLM